MVDFIDQISYLLCPGLCFCFRLSPLYEHMEQTAFIFILLSCYKMYRECRIYYRMNRGVIEISRYLMFLFCIIRNFWFQLLLSEFSQFAISFLFLFSFDFVFVTRRACEEINIKLINHIKRQCVRKKKKTLM